MKKSFRLIVMFCVLMFSTLIIGSSIPMNEEQTQTNKEKVLYLTFDDGPSEYTQELLDILAKHHMKATFFMLDAEMKRFPDVVKRMVEEGHAVGVHGVSHEKNIFYSGTLGPLNEMEQANMTLESITGLRTVLARTPYGSKPYLTVKQESELVNHQYILWDWNIDSRDWCYRNSQKTFYNTTKMVEKTKEEPKVVLFHDMKSAIETMNLFINWMEQRNYTSKAITTDLEPVKLYYKK